MGSLSMVPQVLLVEQGRVDPLRGTANARPQQVRSPHCYLTARNGYSPVVALLRRPTLQRLLREWMISEACLQKLPA